MTPEPPGPAAPLLPAETSAPTKYVRVAIPVPLRREFTYSFGPSMAASITPGKRVIVPFGRQILTGVVRALEDERPAGVGVVRPVFLCPDDRVSVSERVMALCEWIAEYYVSPVGMVLRHAFPAGGRARLYALDAGSTPASSAIMGGARKRPLLDLLERLKAPHDVRLLDDQILAGAIRIEAAGRGGKEETDGFPVIDVPGTFSTVPIDVTLTSAQAAAVSAIQVKLETGAYASFLLHGVTGSGKTVVYLKAAERSLQLGKGVIFLVPEIALTPMLSESFRKHFSGRVAVFHSAMTPRERKEEWLRIRRSEAAIVVGPRSAVFTPVAPLGLVIVDEEHDTSYKQEENPRYNARDVALVRASLEGAVAVLGSATPSMETYLAARSGKHELLTLPERFGDRPLPRVETIDMREDLAASGLVNLLSGRLKDAIALRLERREQIMILINRRGWAAFLLCRKCGENLKCVHCSVSLTYHKKDHRMRCHYCGYGRVPPKACPSCNGELLQLVGHGTQRVEEELRDLFPSARIARLDRDVARRRGEAEKTLAGLRDGEIDVLVGTQMIAKGHDFPGVTLVGVISIDQGLALPDFRASERTFQLVAQVAGRTGRGDLPGEAILQSFMPNHYAIELAREQRFERFYEREVHFRRLTRYPPFTALVNVIVHGKTPDRAEQDASSFARALQAAAQGEEIDILGPQAAPVSRIRGEYRYQIILRGTRRRPMGNAVRVAAEAVQSRISAERLEIDVDPLSLL